MSDIKHNGGPAFPGLTSITGYGCCKPTTAPNGEVLWEEHSPGISVRDYFMAHAPTEPQEWFAPKMETNCPEYPEGAKWCDNCRDDSGSCTGEANCTQMRETRDKRNAWKGERLKQRHIQWPAAWADEMLKQRI